MPALTIADLTAATTTGAGIFDVLMRATKAHLDQEFVQGRIKGSEYSTVYLGQVELAMQTGLAFLLQKDKNALEAELIAKQIELATVQVSKAEAELAILQATQLKIPAEIAHLEAQTANITAEGLNIPKQGEVLDAQVHKLGVEATHTTAQTSLVTQQTANALTENGNLVKQGELLGVQKLHIVQQTENLAAEELNIPKQGLVLDAQKNHVTQQTTNLVAEALNIPKQGLVLDAQECKLKAEFELIKKQTLKTGEEMALLTQKVATERAQTQAMGVDEDSVIGKQKGLYGAQTSGFARDAEQKAAKLMADVWSVQRTTNEETGVAGTGLDNTAISAVIAKLRAGIGA